MRIKFGKSILLMILFLVIFTIQIQSKESNLKYKDYRYSYAKMQELASPTKLRHRIFYEEPSKGPNAEWFDAVKKGDFSKVKKMVEQGQDIEAKDTGALDQTALGWAAFIGYEDITDYLIEKGADLYATDKGDVYNSFKSAVLGDNVAIVKKLYSLMKDNIDINAQEDDGETFLIVASSNNRKEIVKYLLDLGANPDIYSQQKNTSPLSLACDSGFDEIRDILIKKGAINHKTKKSSCNI